MDPDASIILVGVRGAGKRTLGLIAATALNWRYITEDLYFERTTEKTRAAYIQMYGIQTLYKKNVEIIRSMLLRHRKRCVIECGWAGLSSDIHELLRTFCETNPVIHITRSLEQIQSLLQLDEMQTSLFRRADEYHRGCSNYEFYNIQDWNDKDQGTGTEAKQPTLLSVFRLKGARSQFCSFLDLIRKNGRQSLTSLINQPLSTIPLIERSATHVVAVRLSDLLKRNPHLEDIEIIEDAVELKIDEFSDGTLQRISEKVAALRRNFSVPVIYSIAVHKAEQPQTAGYSDVEFQILKHGLRLGSDFLVVDLSQITTALQNLLLQRRSSRLLGHCEIPWDGESVDKGIDMYRKATMLGCDVARIVYTKGAIEIESNAFDRSLNTIRNLVSSFAKPRPALITYGEGFSDCIPGLVSNKILTPVYHPELSGQEDQPRYHLATKDLMKIRFQQMQLDPLRIYLIGNVPLRVAPAMFKAALDATGLAFEYLSQDTINEDALKQLAKDEYFGGASITYGFKTIVSPYVDIRSQHAVAIGAINTLMPLRTSQVQAQAGNQLLVDRGRSGPIYGWFGENTDWIGMSVCIQRNLSPRNAIQNNKTAGLVVGAGGMARAAIYAMLQLGVKDILAFNASAKDPNTVPEHFSMWLRSHGRENQRVMAFHNPHEQWPATIEPPTIIISCPTAKIGGDSSTSLNEKIPEQWLQSKTGGLVLEMVYKPLITPVVQQIQELRARSGQPWVTVNGLEMLTEQGSVQFELLTGRKAPRLTMRREACKAYAKEELENNF